MLKLILQILVGRGKDSDIVFTTDKSVSRSHATFNLSENRECITLTDHKSTFSTKVNGVAIQPDVAIALSDGITNTFLFSIHIDNFSFNQVIW